MISGNVNAMPTVTTTQNAIGRTAGVLEYFDLDHSNPPPICNNNTNTSASTSNLSLQSSFSAIPVANNSLSNRFSTLGISTASVFGAQNALHKSELNSGASSLNTALISGNASNNPVSSGIVYKSVDFIKTEAFMRTRQDAEMARAKNRSKE